MKSAVKQSSIAACLILSIASFLPAATAQTPGDPFSLVNKFHEGLIEMMQLPGYDDRITSLRSIVENTFDTATVARIALGRNWRKLQENDQTTISNLMTELIVSSYASRFPGYTNEQFEVIGEKPLKSNRTIVRTRLLTTTQTVDLDYQLVVLDGHWKIFDVVANGVSDLSLKRATFKSSSVNGVIEAIKQTIHNNRTRAKVDS